ncbi:MAG: 50S ribosomal protein L4 [Candidatus Pacearchaeota archaeon]|nr:MAG: 50S ribosomal protein L4 [Candidatus Pacearchaeota archaeon]
MTSVISIEGKKIKEIKTPEFFKEKIREDIVSKVLEIKKTFQPHSPSPVAGKQHSASGNIRHARRKWKTSYGRGISRVPRKILVRRGSRFIWVGAEVASTRGGRRAHPPKVVSMINTKKINKKEALIALKSALSASSNKEYICKKYKKINLEKLKDIELPLVIDSKILDLKTKDFEEVFKKILGNELYSIFSIKRKIRAGKGKSRGRKYKKNAGLLIVIGNDEKIKAKIFESVKVKDLSLLDLARGGIGRFVVYTEQAIKDLEDRLKK